MTTLQFVHNIFVYELLLLSIRPILMSIVAIGYRMKMTCDKLFVERTIDHCLVFDCGTQRFKIHTLKSDLY